MRTGLTRLWTPCSSFSIALSTAVFVSDVSRMRRCGSWRTKCQMICEMAVDLPVPGGPCTNDKSRASRLATTASCCAGLRGRYECVATSRQVAEPDFNSLGSAAPPAAAASNNAQRVCGLSSFSLGSATRRRAPERRAIFSRSPVRLGRISPAALSRASMCARCSEVVSGGKLM